MEFFGYIAFVLACVQIGNGDKIKKLQRELRLLKRQNKEVSKMSDLLNELVGKSCKLTNSSGVQTKVLEVIAVDDEWIKYTVQQKENLITKIDRIEKFDSFEIL